MYSVVNEIVEVNRDGEGDGDILEQSNSDYNAVMLSKDVENTGGKTCAIETTGESVSIEQNATKEIDVIAMAVVRNQVESDIEEMEQD